MIKQLIGQAVTETSKLSAPVYFERSLLLAAWIIRVTGISNPVVMYVGQTQYEGKFSL